MRCGLILRVWNKEKFAKMLFANLSWRRNGEQEMTDEEVDYCYECTGYGDDYYVNEDGDWVCYCPECPHNGENEE